MPEVVGTDGDIAVDRRASHVDRADLPDQAASVADRREQPSQAAGLLRQAAAESSLDLAVPPHDRDSSVIGIRIM
jgi:hypothetical protein